MAGRRLIVPSLLVMLTLGGLAFSGISGVQGFGRAGNFPVPTGAVVPASRMPVIKKSDPVAPSSATNYSSGIKCTFAAGICLGMALRFCKGVVAVRGRPDLKSAEIPTDPLKGRKIENAEVVRIGTDGLASHVTTVSHQGERLTLDDGTTGILHRMPDGIRFDEDNGNWTTDREIKVDPGCTFDDAYDVLKKNPDYNAVTNNCVQSTDAVAEKISTKEKLKKIKQDVQTASAVVTAGAESVFQDVANGREVDVNAAVSKSVGAGVGAKTSQHIKGVTGSTPVAAAVGTLAAEGVSSKLQGESNEQAMKAGCQAGMAAGAQEFVGFTVQNATNCAPLGQAAKGLVNEAPNIGNDVMNGRGNRALNRSIAVVGFNLLPSPEHPLIRTMWGMLGLPG